MEWKTKIQEGSLVTTSLAKKTYLSLLAVFLVAL